MSCLPFADRHSRRILVQHRRLSWNSHVFLVHAAGIRCILPREDVAVHSILCCTNVVCRIAPSSLVGAYWNDRDICADCKYPQQDHPLSYSRLPFGRSVYSNNAGLHSTCECSLDTVSRDHVYGRWVRWLSDFDCSGSLRKRCVLSHDVLDLAGVVGCAVE